MVASDDDRSPTLQMWDLRNSVSPLKEFVGHTKVGICARRGGQATSAMQRLGTNMGSSDGCPTLPLTSHFHLHRVC